MKTYLQVWSQTFSCVLCMYKVLAFLLCAGPVIHVRKIKLYFVSLEFCMPKCKYANPDSLSYNHILASALQSRITPTLRYDNGCMCATVLRGGISLLVGFLIS